MQNQYWSQTYLAVKDNSVEVNVCIMGFKIVLIQTEKMCFYCEFPVAWNDSADRCITSTTTSLFPINKLPGVV